jgi:general secretion pathway protein D
VTTDATRPIAPQPAGAASDPVAAGARADSGGPAVPGALVGQTIIVANGPTNALVIRTQPPNFPAAARDHRGARRAAGAGAARGDGGRGGARARQRVRDRLGGQQPRRHRRRRRDRGAAGGARRRHAPGVQPRAARARLLRFDDLDVRALLRAVSTRNQVRVLSTPEILAMNNREARILVGSKVPFVRRRGSATSRATRRCSTRTWGRRSPSCPTVNDDDYVSVQILQEVSALTSQTLPVGAQRARSSRPRRRPRAPCCATGRRSSSRG